MLSTRKEGYFTGNANSLQQSTSLAVPIYPCLIVFEEISSIANKVSPFDPVQNKITSDALGPEDDQYCFHEFNEYLNSLNPQKQLLKEVEDGAGANIFPRDTLLFIRRTRVAANGI